MCWMASFWSICPRVSTRPSCQISTRVFSGCGLHVEQYPLSSQRVMDSLQGVHDASTSMHQSEWERTATLKAW